MDRTTARTIADALTWTRIFSVIPITVLALLGLKWWVLAVYVVSALTDLLDGWFARRGAPPKTDADLDGIADLILSFSTLLWLWLLIPGFVSAYWLPYLPVFIALEIYMSVVRVKHKRYSVPHLRFGRFAMALFFTLLPAMIVWGDIPWFVHLVLIVGVASKLQLTWAFWTRSRETAA